MGYVDNRKIPKILSLYNLYMMPYSNKVFVRSKNNNKLVSVSNLVSYNEEGKFLPWVMRISHNLVIDHFRKSNRIPIFESKDDFDIFKFTHFIF